MLVVGAGLRLGVLRPCVMDAVPWVWRGEVGVCRLVCRGPFSVGGGMSARLG